MYEARQNLLLRNGKNVERPPNQRLG